MPDQDLALLVDRFMRRIHYGLQGRAAEFDRKAVGPGGGIILMTLAEMGCAAQNELTKKVARDKSQMTRAIRSLESKGLVRREPCAQDGRVTLVALTPDGEAVVAELTEMVGTVIAEILEPITQKEKQTLKQLLARAVT